MASMVDNQNRDIIDAWQKYDGTQVQTNKELVQLLGLLEPPIEYFQNYPMADVRVKVI
jgi:hypothetical protein